MTPRFNIIKEECKKSPKWDENVCIHNKLLNRCDGYKCPILHFFRGTRPPAFVDSHGLLEKYNLEEEYDKDMK